MNQREAYDEGYEKARNGASWIDVPEIGIEYWTDNEGNTTPQNKREIKNLWFDIAQEGLSNARQFSPFEFVARDMNALSEHDSNDCWDAFDRGESMGIADAWRVMRGKKPRRSKLRRNPTWYVKKKKLPGTEIIVCGNGHFREIEYKINEDSDSDDFQACFTYRGQNYFMSEIMRTGGFVENAGFHGVYNFGAFAGLLIKLNSDANTVQVYFYQG